MQMKIRNRCTRMLDGMDLTIEDLELNTVDIGFSLDELRSMRDAFIFIRNERVLTVTETVLYNRIVHAIVWLMEDQA